MRSGKVQVIAPVDFMELHRLRERLRRQRDEPAALLPVRPAAAGRAARLRRPGARPGRLGRRDRADRADPPRLRADRGVRGRRRADGLPEHAEHRGAAGDEHLHPRHEGALDGGERHRDAAQHLHAARRAGPRPARLVEVHRRGALPLRARGRGDVRLAPLAALGQRAHPGGAARPARPLRQHEQPGAAPRQPGRDDQPDPQRLRGAEGAAGEVVLPRLPRLAAAQRPRRGPALSRLLGLQPGDADPAVAGGLGAALRRDDGRQRQDPRPRPRAARRGRLPARDRDREQAGAGRAGQRRGARICSPTSSSNSATSRRTRGCATASSPPPTSCAPASRRARRRVRQPRRDPGDVDRAVPELPRHPHGQPARPRACASPSTW